MRSLHSRSCPSALRLYLHCTLWDLLPPSPQATHDKNCSTAHNLPSKKGMHCQAWLQPCEERCPAHKTHQAKQLNKTGMFSTSISKYPPPSTEPLGRREENLPLESSHPHTGNWRGQRHQYFPCTASNSAGVSDPSSSQYVDGNFPEGDFPPFCPEVLWRGGVTWRC